VIYKQVIGEDCIMNKQEVLNPNIFQEANEAKPHRNWRMWFLGRPLATADAPQQTIGKLIGLAVFSSDALSSVAYGPQEMMMILALSGLASLHYTLPLVSLIVGLLAILTFSYTQTIHAYPNGGGAYIVARDNLGELPAQIAGAALLTDYILTVAVSISSGVANITSAYPVLTPYQVEIAIAMIMIIMLINLRGVKESGITFAIPTYFFLVMMAITILTGFLRLITGTLGTVINPPSLGIGVAQPLTLFLILRAIANGTSSVTGTEAISNGITAFKEPRSRNAAATLVIMALILGFMLLSVSFLAIHIHAIPAEGETVISQVIRTVYDGRGFLYFATVIGTMIILVMAANTAFADFPRLGALTAGDGFLPRQLTYRGSRLVYSRGIIALGVISSLLVFIFHASVTNLIPLYAIGVFLSFTLSQAGMAHRWWKAGHLLPDEERKERGSTIRYEKGWVHKMIINGIGALCTFTVMIIFAVTKFKDGAWIIVLLTPALVFIFFAIHNHYKNLASQLSLENHNETTVIHHNRVIMPIGGVHRGTVKALRFARTLSNDITAVHISIDPQETDKVKAKWNIWGDGYRLVILHSPYRLFLEPLLDYIDKIEEVCQESDEITIVVPQFVPKNPLSNMLHTRTAETLRRALLQRENIVITEVPYQVK
jgi:amino acid transporter